MTHKNIEETIDNALILAIAMHNPKGSFDDVDKMMLGKWKTEIEQALEIALKQAEQDGYRRGYNAKGLNDPTQRYMSPSEKAFNARGNK